MIKINIDRLNVWLLFSDNYLVERFIWNICIFTASASGSLVFRVFSQHSWFFYYVVVDNSFYIFKDNDIHAGDMTHMTFEMNIWLLDNWFIESIPPLSHKLFLANSVPPSKYFSTDHVCRHCHNHRRQYLWRGSSSHR